MFQVLSLPECIMHGVAGKTCTHEYLTHLPHVFYATINVVQAGSGKTHLLRSVKLQQVWREESPVNAGNRDEGGGKEARSVIAVCRNVHANTPYYVWRSILFKIFSFRPEVRICCADLALALFFVFLGSYEHLLLLLST